MTTTTTICAAEQSTAARLGELLFRNRGWLPVPLLVLPLVLPGTQSRESWIAGLLLVALGEAVRIAGVAAAGTVTRRRSRNVQRLVTYGAFGWCRNPLYVGNFLAWIGFTVVSGVFWFIPVSMLLFAFEYTLIVRYEEGVLESIFAQQYLDYKRSTSRWFPWPPQGGNRGEHNWLESIWSEKSTMAQYVLLIVLCLLKDRYLY